jgi:hypothetical protein
MKQAAEYRIISIQLSHLSSFRGPRHILFQHGAIEASDPDILGTQLPSNVERFYKSNNHMTNFVESVRSRRKTICDAEIGHKSATICHLRVSAVRLARKVKCNPTKEEFVGYKDVVAKISRPIRKLWDYDVIKCSFYSGNGTGDGVWARDLMITSRSIFD